jgi:hypothetical protein
MSSLSNRTMKPGALLALTILLAVPAQAQFNGSHTLGGFGVQSGTQPSPGLYAAFFYYRYDADTLKDRNGDSLTLSPDSPGSLGMNAYAPTLWYVTRAKVLGATYGVMAVIPWANGALEAPIFGLDQTTGTRFPTRSSARSTWAGTPSRRTSRPGSSSTRPPATTWLAAATTPGRGRTLVITATFPIPSMKL